MDADPDATDGRDDDLAGLRRASEEVLRKLWDGACDAVWDTA